MKCGRLTILLALRTSLYYVSQTMIRHRPFRSESDYEAIRRLLSDNCEIAGLPTYCTIGDLDWWRFNWSGDTDRMLDACLWEREGGSVIGAACPAGDEIDIFVHPHHREILNEMLEWSERFRIASKPTAADEWLLHVMCLEKDMERMTALTRRGYAKSQMWYSYRKRDLGKASFPSLLPEGYGIHEIAAAEIAGRVEVHRSAFTGSSMSVERYRRIMGAPTYRPELDLVAICSDGSVAGFCLVWLDMHNHLAAVEPLGVHPEHRGIGLGGALVQEGLRRCRDVGASVAVVVTSGANAAANRLYESLGFCEKDQAYRWRKTF